MGTANAQSARQAYKHVDEQGNVTYSQTPPEKRDAKAIGLPPPRSAPPAGRDYERDVMRRQAAEDRRRDWERRQQERQAAVEEARRRRTEDLRAECNRNRGTDCNDPETIRRMEAERGPSQYRPRAGGKS
ncbi:MAG: DUF4124 domain-containing protein [Burkholderiales bacterium]|nr:DUF4124 domain-containing protein [Burkholderiales bacterium]